jgi:rhomboid protease GluP
MGSSPTLPTPHGLRQVLGGSGSGPAVGPPETGYDFRPQPVRRPRPSWAYAPATYFLVGINCAVFLAMVANHAGIWSPSPEVLMHWGANNAGSVLIQGQWWRIVTAMFVHVGIIHLATNMWCLWNLGLLAEPLLGSAGVLAVYILTGAAGNLLSTLFNWWTNYGEWTRYHAEWAGHHALGEIFDPTLIFPPGAGASGAVFGIAGALIILLKSNRLPVPAAELRRLRKSVIYFAAINLVIPVTFNFGAAAMHTGMRIDSMAHLGGVTCGLLFAVPLVPRLGSPRSVFRERLRIAVVMVVGILVLFGFYLTKLPG